MTVKIEDDLVSIQISLYVLLIRYFMELVSECFESFIIKNHFFLDSLYCVPIDHFIFLLSLDCFFMLNLNWNWLYILSAVVFFNCLFMKKSTELSVFSNHFLMIVRLTLTCMCFWYMTTKGWTNVKSFTTKLASIQIIICLLLIIRFNTILTYSKLDALFVFLFNQSLLWCDIQILW